MSESDTYTRSIDYNEQQTNEGQVQGANMNIDFDNLANAYNANAARLNEIRRSDSTASVPRLNNTIVALESLGADVLATITLFSDADDPLSLIRGEWVTARDYTPGDIITTTVTATSNADDITIVASDGVNTTTFTTSGTVVDSAEDITVTGTGGNTNQTITTVATAGGVAETGTYICLTSHTSDDFLADLGNDLWFQLAGNSLTGLGADIGAGAAASAAVAAVSAAAALVSENAAAADLVLTNADVVSTGDDVTATNADVVTTGNDVISTNADAVSTSNDVTATNADVVQTNADVVTLTGTASTTSLLIEVASKAFTVTAGLGFQVGDFVLVTSDADEANFMHGQITAYVTTTMTVDVTTIGGAGTLDDWTIRRSGVKGATGATGPAGPGSGDMLASVYDPVGIVEQLIGINAAQTLANKTVQGGLPINLDGDDNITIDGRTNPRTITLGAMRFNHTAGIDGTRAIHIDIESAGFNDTTGIVIRHDLAGSSVVIRPRGIDLQADVSGMTNAHLNFMEFQLAGSLDSSARADAIDVRPGISVIHHHSGTVAAAGKAFTFDDSGASFADVTTAFGSAGTDVQIFVEDDDLIYIGDVAMFTDIEAILAIVAVNPGVKPTFEYSQGSSTWATLPVSDGTNGFRENGTISFAAPGDWATETVNGDAGKFWVRIKRTTNSLGTVPTEDTIKIIAAVEYEWDEDGNINLNNITGKKLIAAPDVDQAITAASDTLPSSASHVEITPDADYIMTSTPSIAAGVDGQILLMHNMHATNTVTLQDNSVLADTDVFLGGAEGTIKPESTMTLHYSADISGWVVTSNPNTASAGAAADLVPIRNVSGGPLDAGDIVYVTGHLGLRATVDLADANDPAKMDAVGAIATAVGNNANGEMITAGYAAGIIDTSTAAINDGVWVDSTTPGGVVFSRPTADKIQQIGTVVRVHASAGLVLMDVGRSNDVPIILPDLTRAITQSASDNSTKLATTAYADAAGGGGMGELITRTAITSDVPSVEFTTGFLEHQQVTFVLESVSQADATVLRKLRLQVSDDGGSTWKTTGYKFTGWFFHTGGSAVVTDTSGIVLGNDTGAIFATEAIGHNGSVTLSNVNNASQKLTAYGGVQSYNDSTNDQGGLVITGRYDTAGAINAVRFLFDTGNINGNPDTFISMYRQVI